MTDVATFRMTYRRHRRRRMLARLATVLSLGLISTLAAAVFCALWSREMVIFIDDPKPVSAESEPPFPEHLGYIGFGVRGEVRQWWPWAESLSTFTDDHRAFGWPLGALSYRLLDMTKPGSPESFWPVTQIAGDDLSGTYLIGGLSAHRGGARWLGQVGRHIPVTPRPVGLAVNTLAAAVPLYLLLFGWADLRAIIRARRGRCARCGYDVRGLPQCPECGLETASPLPAVQPRISVNTSGALT